jgi:hypothetical protein
MRVGGLRQPQVLFAGQGSGRPQPRSSAVRLVFAGIVVVACAALSLSWMVATSRGGEAGSSSTLPPLAAAVILPAPGRFDPSSTASVVGSPILQQQQQQQQQPVLRAMGGGGAASSPAPPPPPRGPIRRFVRDPSGDAAAAIADPSAPLPPRVLVLTPVKNAMKHLGRYFSHLRNLSYAPASCLSLGILDSDSDDAPDVPMVAELLARGYAPGDVASMSGTLAAVLLEAPAMLEHGWASVTVVSHDFNFSLPRGVRHGREVQRQRRSMLARARNHLVSSALTSEEEWVLWVDSDLYSYSPRTLAKLVGAATEGPAPNGHPIEILVPNCVMSPGGAGRSYDLNSWRGGTAPGNNASVREVVAWHDAVAERAQDKGGSKQGDLWLEGYGQTGNTYMHRLRAEGKVVRLDAVGGAMLLVRGELHRHGLVFPPVVYRHRIETEGLSMMAMDMGALSWGMPGVEVVHH